MHALDRASLLGLVALAAAALTAAIGVEPVAAITTATAGPIPTVDVLALQLFDTVIEILDRIADLLSQINRVLSELSQLFGEGGEGGD